MVHTLLLTELGFYRTSFWHFWLMADITINPCISSLTILAIYTSLQDRGFKDSLRQFSMFGLLDNAFFGEPRRLLHAVAGRNVFTSDLFPTRRIYLQIVTPFG